MIVFNKILCPFDFSDHANEALKYALKLADDDTEITLLNVFQIPYILNPEGYIHLNIDYSDLAKSNIKALEDKIAEVKLMYPQININFKYETDADAADEIIKIQKEFNYDIIVIGSHGRRGVSRLLLGSTAEMVLREATCPVLIIKLK